MVGVSWRTSSRASVPSPPPRSRTRPAPRAASRSATVLMNVTDGGELPSGGLIGCETLRIAVEIRGQRASAARLSCQTS
jgi:hypothetical protein